MKIKAKRLSDTAKLPTYGSEKAACFDICADLRPDACSSLNPDAKIPEGNNSSVFSIAGIPPHGTMKIPTGWAFQPPDGYMLQILQRSGLASKGLICVDGILDNDYTGEVVIILLNTTDDDIIIHNNDRIAQIALRKYDQAEFELVDELDKTERGIAGFGSTGA